MVLIFFGQVYSRRRIQSNWRETCKTLYIYSQSKSHHPPYHPTSLTTTVRNRVTVIAHAHIFSIILLQQLFESLRGKQMWQLGFCFFGRSHAIKFCKIDYSRRRAGNAHLMRMRQQSIFSTVKVYIRPQLQFFSF